jgi:F-type H+-transporting ATPase subunit gamma
MTERLADINTHIAGIRQLRSVVNAMRGIAGARAQQARSQLAAVDDYTQIIAQSIGQVLALAPLEIDGTRATGRSAIVVFCAEQGFAGAYSEHVLNALTMAPAAEPPATPAAELFLIGTRGAAIARERGITPYWTGAMPSNSAGIPKFVGQIAEALYAHIAEGKIDRLDAAYSQWRAGQGINVAISRLFPLDLAGFLRPAERHSPLFHLPPEILLSDFMAEHVHAQLCHAALHAFAAENEARMAAMASTHSQIEQQLASLQLLQSIVRQEAITAEIVELSAAAMAERG